MTEFGPLHVFRFRIDFYDHPLNAASGSKISVCGGAFAECTGLEVTMEPKVIKEGGRNYGAIQRAGPVTFATVILKRGMMNRSDLWEWMTMITSGQYAVRRDAKITVFDTDGTGVLGWKLSRALPVKFKLADLNAKGTDVGVEELHLAHEGLFADTPEAKL